MYCHGNPVKYKDPSGHFSDRAIYPNTFNNNVDKLKMAVVTEKIDKGDTLSKLVERRVEDLAKKGIKTNSKVEMNQILEWNPQIKNPDNIKAGDRLITDVHKNRETTKFGSILEKMGNFDATVSTSFAFKHPKTKVGAGETFTFSYKMDFDKGPSARWIDTSDTLGYSPDTKFSWTMGLSQGDGNPSSTTTINYRYYVVEIDRGKDKNGLRVGSSTDPTGVVISFPTGNGKEMYNFNLRESKYRVLNAEANQFLKYTQMYRMKNK